MKSVRDWEWTRESWFYDDPDVEDVVFGTLMIGTLMGAIFSFAIGLAFDAIFGGAVGWTVFGVLWASAISHCWWVPKVNRFGAIDSYNMRRIGYHYRSLSNKDRQEFFPANFEKMLKQANRMTTRQQNQIYDEFYRITREIERRDAAIKQAEAQHIDTDDLLDDLRRGRQYAEIEAQTMREYL